MPTPFKSMLFYLSEIAKTNNYREPFCPICGERLCITKHGFYRRYLFYGSEQTGIQRYCCGNPDCPRKTFSCLPHPFLPLIRLPLCALKAMLDMVHNCKMTIAEIARVCHIGWSRAHRGLKTARRLFGWIKKEATASSWGPSACLDPDQHWPAFILSVSYAFYHNRC